jgi:tape measure domain-containing protein
VANGEVGIKIKVSARDAVNNLNKLKTLSTKLQTSFKKVETAAARLQNRAGASFQKFGNKVRKVRRKVQVDLGKMQKSFKGLNNIGTLIGGAGLGLFAKASSETAANAQALELRLKLLTQEFGEYEQAQDLASRAAKTFGMSNIEATEGVTNIIGRLRPLGLSLKQIETTFFGFNTAAKLAGVSSVEASNAFRQLAQALGSGRLAGDEFRSISEQVPTILKPISDELGVPVGKLKELAAQGKITSSVVIRALEQIQKEGAGKVAGIIEESDIQVFKNLNNALENLRKTVGDKLNVVLLPLTENLTSLVTAFNEANPVVQGTVVFLGAVAGAAALAIPAVATLGIALKGITAVFATKAGVALLGFLTVTNLPVIALIAGLATAFGGLAVSIGKANIKRREFQDKLESGSVKILEEARATETNTIAQLGNAKGRGNAARGTQRQIEEAKERIRLIDEEIEKLNFLKGVLDETYTVGGITYNRRTGRPIDPPETGSEKPPKPPISDKTPLLDELNKEREFLNNALKMGTAKAKLEERIRDLMKEQNNLSEEAARKKIEQLDADQKRLALQEQIKDILATGMTDAVMGLIEGTKTLGQALADIAKSLAKMFLNAAFRNIFSGLNFGSGEQGLYNRTGGFKAFQQGGVVNSPTLGMIGEGGESEYVIPSSKMDGAMARYSAGARGGAVIPGGSHESGTVAGGSGNTVVEYTGPTLNFNGDEYVPKSAVPEIIGAASKQGAIAGKAQVLGTLRNSRSQRASLGL